MLKPSARSPFTSRRFDSAEDLEVADRSEATRPGRSLPPGLIAVAAAAERKRPKKRWPSLVLGVLAFTVAVVAMQWVLPSGGGSKGQTKSFMPSVLKDVGHVIGTRKGVGIER
ncbi:MAG: hypothetical protein AAGG01_02760 [Planctomycetota bacterium]